MNNQNTVILDNKMYFIQVTFNLCDCHKELFWEEYSNSFIDPNKTEINKLLDISEEMCKKLNHYSQYRESNSNSDSDSDSNSYSDAFKEYSRYLKKQEPILINKNITISILENRENKILYSTKSNNISLPLGDIIAVLPLHLYMSHLNKEDCYRDDFNIPFVAHVPPNPIVSRYSQLRVGWIQLEDPASGRPYYGNQTTGESQWDFPYVDSDSDSDSGKEYNEIKIFAVSPDNTLFATLHTSKCYGRLKIYDNRDIIFYDKELMKYYEHSHIRFFDIKIPYNSGINNIQFKSRDTIQNIGKCIFKDKYPELYNVIKMEFSNTEYILKCLIPKGINDSFGFYEKSFCLLTKKVISVIETI